MKSLNKVTLIGHLGTDLEFKNLPNDLKVAQVNMATSERFYDKNKVLQTNTDWHHLVFWGNLAEIANTYLKKGSFIYVEGKLKTRSYEDKENIKKYVTEIQVDNFILLDKKNEPSTV